MRSEQEMFDLILGTARNDERIRAVIMNGSRTHTAAPRDIFQDYDIMYMVTDLLSFIADPAWIDRFGERMILQLPDTMGEPPPQSDGSFTYLIQFMDGNRIDLNLFPLEKLHEREEESLRVLLLDKDGLFMLFPPPSDYNHLPQPPSAHVFADCCNEFWWVLTYVAKGLWRQELPYAKAMMDELVRGELLKMLTWYVGVQTGFTRSPGKFGKYLKDCLPAEMWALLEQTYADADYGRTWDALLVMGDLFRQAAQQVARSRDSRTRSATTTA
jgi:aminoglycoside 6-adenylyltransferase